MGMHAQRRLVETNQDFLSNLVSRNGWETGGRSQNDSPGNVRMENRRSLVHSLRCVLSVACRRPAMRKAAAPRAVTAQWPPSLHLEASQTCGERKPDQPLLHLIMLFLKNGPIRTQSKQRLTTFV